MHVAPAGGVWWLVSARSGRARGRRGSLTRVLSTAFSPEPSGPLLARTSRLDTLVTVVAIIVSESSVQPSNPTGAYCSSAMQTQQTQNICITFVQCWTNVEDVGQALYKCYTTVLWLLEKQTAVPAYLKLSRYFILPLYDSACNLLPLAIQLVVFQLGLPHRKWHVLTGCAGFRSVGAECPWFKETTVITT